MAVDQQGVHPMRQKPGPLRPSPTVETSGPSTSRPSPYDRPADLDSSLSGHFRPDAVNEPSGVSSNSTPGVDLRAESSVVVTQLPDMTPTAYHVASSPLQAYVQNPGSELSAPDADGLRTYKGRKFASVVSDDAEVGTQTVMVVFHEPMKAFRAKLPTERTPSGPPLYRVENSDTWSLKKPHEYYDPQQYISSHTTDSRGYYSIHRNVKFENTGPNRNETTYMVDPRTTSFALKDEQGRLIRVDPLEARGDLSIPLKLAHWSDGEIWSAYRLEGAQVLIFRSEAEATGRAPDWVVRFNEPKVYKFLTTSLRWPYPQKSLAERKDILRSYNLSIAQQNRLRHDMEHGVFPEWAEQHKQLTQDTRNEQRFKHIAEELEPFILVLRQTGEQDKYDLPPVEQRYERHFLNNYLEHAGYKRNQHDCLYRTDIPAMFRADLRTPFELARDKRLVKLRGNPSDSTTKSALSATFGVENGLTYMGFDYYSNPRHYNSQANRYPGHFSDSDSSSGNRHSSGEESDTSFVRDDSRDYPLLRRKQGLGFLYVIDTRGIEVVPRVENIFLNDREFDGDSLEGRISMPTRGISAERIWLVHTDLQRAARVEDVFAMAGEHAEAIEQQTWAGADARSAWLHGHTPYDQLINRIANSGGVILNLPKGEKTFSNDVSWPVAEHYRA
jgi:hypothetical protein